MENACTENASTMQTFSQIKKFGISQVSVVHFEVGWASGLQIPVLGSQPAGDMSHKPGGRLPLLSARPAVTLATLKRAAANFAAW